jgi:hypothetical protein
MTQTLAALTSVMALLCAAGRLCQESDFGGNGEAGKALAGAERVNAKELTE